MKSAGGVVVLVVALLLLPVTTSAQARAGERVRVTAPALLTAPAAGTLLGADGSAMRVEVARGVELTVPNAGVDRIELSEGRGLGRSMLVGATGGLLVGAVIGAAVVVAEAEGDDLGQFVGGTAGGIAGGVIGIPMGAFVGAVIAREKWRPGGAPPNATTADSTAASILVRPTTRIRVTPTNADRFAGRATSASSGLSVDSDDRIVALDWSEVERLEVRGRNRSFGAMVGAVLLGGVTLVAASIDYAQDEVGGAAVVLNTGLNAAIGAGIGALIAPPTWRDVPLPR